jgi:hypothetical protein
MNIGLESDGFLFKETSRDTGAGPALGLGQNIAHFDRPHPGQAVQGAAPEDQDDKCDFAACLILVFTYRW